MALWNACDPKLKELGLVSDQDDVAKAMYDSRRWWCSLSFAASPRATPSRKITRATGADRPLHHGQDRRRSQFDRDGKTYVEVKDYQKMHEGVGMLLAEMMRIKAEGDYDAIKALMENTACTSIPSYATRWWRATRRWIPRTGRALIRS